MASESLWNLLVFAVILVKNKFYSAFIQIFTTDDKPPKRTQVDDFRVFDEDSD